MASNNLKKILKNNTSPPVVLELNDIGISIPAGGQITLEPGRYYTIQEEIGVSGTNTIRDLIETGKIVVNDGVTDLSPDRGVDYLKYPDRAFNIRFESETERSNGFVSKNIQEAIEEGRNSAVGSILPYPFIASGNTSDKWLGYFHAGAPSNEIPLIVPQESKIKGITFTNRDNNVDINVEIYKNGLLVYTWEIRNKRVAWKLGISENITFVQGDRISCFLRKFTGGTGDSTAQDPVVAVQLKIQTEKSAEGGLILIV